MPTQKLFKRRVRERMAKTGESYTSARRHVVPGRDQQETAKRRLASAKELASDEKMTQATGRDWNVWLSILDRWGEADRTHGEIAEHLRSAHGVPGWWTQAIATGYERARGLRMKHQQPDGFTVYALKTVGVPLAALYDAFANARTRPNWLTDGSMSARSSQRGKVARFDWDGDLTRVEVTFESKGPMKATAHVAHSRLPNEGAAEVTKALWKQRVSALKSFLEAIHD